jgi:hypothetical protein
MSDQRNARVRARDLVRFVGIDLGYQYQYWMVPHTSLPIHACIHNEVAKSDGCWFLAGKKMSANSCANLLVMTESFVHSSVRRRFQLGHAESSETDPHVSSRGKAGHGGTSEEGPSRGIECCQLYDRYCPHGGLLLFAAYAYRGQYITL